MLSNVLCGIPVLNCLCFTLAFYHLSEVCLVLSIVPEEYEFPASWLMSTPYLCAMLLGLFEYFVEVHFYPLFKAALVSILAPIGCALVLIGEVTRKTAWLTARVAFTHRIQVVRRPGHNLVTHGIYSYCRHPAYLGWMMWAVGTQLLIANPICAIAFAVTTWKFFSVRIPYEDSHLERLFGAQFLEYKEEVPTCLPGIT
jgi:protein-S-isoprenylcysteine O-methyltransferase